MSHAPFKGAAVSGANGLRMARFSTALSFPLLIPISYNKSLFLLATQKWEMGYEPIKPER
jgi:hypothetical protein